MTAQYYITRVPGSDHHFKIAKFSGDAQPDNIYFLTMFKRGERGWVRGHTDPQFHCDCPNRRRAKHINDKHGVMVAKWLLAHEPVGYFDDKGEFHGAAETLDRGLTIDEPANDAADRDPDPDGGTDDY